MTTQELIEMASRWLTDAGIQERDDVLIREAAQVIVTHATTGPRTNQVLDTILTTQTVTNGSSVFPLGNSHIDHEEGALLQRVIGTIGPTTSLEIGMAYGISTLYICEALSRLPGSPRHIVIDKFQSSWFHGVGLYNLRQAGYETLIEFHEEGSEVALPRLMMDGRQIDLAFIDGWHTFDHVLMEFFFLNRLLRVGGVLVFDDADWPGVHRAIRHVLTYPAYQLLDCSASLCRIRGRAPGGSDPCGTCVALRKVDHDQRSWDWYADF